jgi:hypothetical protein
MKHCPFSVYLLAFLLFFLALGGFFGGINLVLYPSGDSLSMPLSYLQHSPFRDYLIPGLILLSFMGIFPLMLVYALLVRPAWTWANVFNIYAGQHWAWTYSVYAGIILIIWIDIQIMLVGYGHIIQTIYALLGVVITITALLPSTKTHFARIDNPT